MAVNNEKVCYVSFPTLQYWLVLEAGDGHVSKFSFDLALEMLWAAKESIVHMESLAVTLGFARFSLSTCLLLKFAHIANVTSKERMSRTKIRDADRVLLGLFEFCCARVSHSLVPQFGL